MPLADHGDTLYIGNSKGDEGHPDRKGPGSPLASKWYGDETIKTIQKSSIETVSLTNIQKDLPNWTKQVIENTPYNDSLLSEARPPLSPTIIPSGVGVPTEIKHVIYIIKENRTSDQVFGDIKGANGDPALTIFGEDVTPNQHALVRKYVTLDNLYCDGEVSGDGHSWSDSAYATDFNERYWPSNYGAEATLPAVAHMSLPPAISGILPSVKVLPSAPMMNMPCVPAQATALLPRRVREPWLGPSPTRYTNSSLVQKNSGHAKTLTISYFCDSQLQR